MPHRCPPHLIALRAQLAGYAFELAAIRFQLLLRKANFNPGQLRDAIGRWMSEGGGSDRPQPAQGRRGSIRVNVGGRLLEATPGQAARFAVAEPRAREAEARLAEVLPRGFGTYERYVAFGQSMRDGLRAAGYRDVEPTIRGSAVTGENFRTREPFDAGRRSDYDVALVSPALLQRAIELGIPLRGGGTRTRQLRREELTDFGLRDLAASLSRSAERDVSFMIYNSRHAVTRRGPSRPVLGR